MARIGPAIAPEEALLRQGLAGLVNRVGMHLAQGDPVRQVLQVIENEAVVLQPLIDRFRRADAEAWLEQQARTLKPRKPRDTAAKRRRALLAELAAAERF